MLLILADLLIAAALVLTVVYLGTKVIRQHNQSKIDSALARQKQAELDAAEVKKLNPEKTLENEKTVQETLNKLS